jgi:hypothetical protein
MFTCCNVIRVIQFVEATVADATLLCDTGQINMSINCLMGVSISPLNAVVYVYVISQLSGSLI